MRTGLLAAGLALVLTGAALAETRYRLLSFDDLSGWRDDDLGAALDVFRSTCNDMDGPDWTALCSMAGTDPDPREFFERFFTPVLIEDGDEALFTGYFEPELRGARSPHGRYQHPVYRLPDLLDQPMPTRRQIEEEALLANQGLEIAWVDDPVDLFFLQVQGSGRIRLEDGGMIRVGYAGANGHEYSSVGRELVARGIYDPHQVSADVIRYWVRNNPEAGRELLWTNASYVFFREVNEVPPHLGPLGAMNRPVTELRSIAVDPAHVPLGAPVWIETNGETAFRRLMVAQDTGSAIRGAQRADIFFGTGAEAGRQAGRVKDGGRMVVLLPIQRALSLIPDTVE